jgi:hypothetical protein
VLTLNHQILSIVVAGFGMGLMLSPVNTDAVSRAGRLSYGEATGITQTVRNFGASIGLATLGTVLITQFTNRLTTSLEGLGLSATRARAIAESAQSSYGTSGQATAAERHLVARDFAKSVGVIFTAMGVLMAVAAVVGFILLPRGVQAHPTEAPAASTV